MIVIPLSVDQPANAKRVQHHQLGYACLPQDCTPTHLEHLLTDAISNEEFRSHLEGMGEVFRTVEQEAPILNYLKKFLSD